ncbi:Mucin 68D [Carabus blaptoides fortunei]
MCIKILLLCTFVTAIFAIDCPSSTIVPIHSADRRSCSKFIRCYNGQLHTLTCPQGMFFDIEESVCKRQDLVNCGDRDQTVPYEDPVKKVFCPDAVTATIPNPDDCSSFYECYNGRPFIMHCPENLLFNKEKKYCDWPQDANCCEN